MHSISVHRLYKERGELYMAEELPTLKQNIINVFNDPPHFLLLLHNIS